MEQEFQRMDGARLQGCGMVWNPEDVTTSKKAEMNALSKDTVCTVLDTSMVNWDRTSNLLSRKEVPGGGRRGMRVRLFFGKAVGCLQASLVSLAVRWLVSRAAGTANQGKRWRKVMILDSNRHA